MQIDLLSGKRIEFPVPVGGGGTMNAPESPYARTLENYIIALAEETQRIGAALPLAVADAAALAAAVPAFIGQLAVENDTGALYIGTGTTAGAWSLYPGA